MTFIEPVLAAEYTYIEVGTKDFKLMYVAFTEGPSSQLRQNASSKCCC